MNIGQRLRQCDKPFYSLEFFPPKDRDQWPAFLETVERLKTLSPLFASVTYGAGGSTQDGTLEIAARIAALGLEPLVHLTCVGATEASLTPFLRRLREVGVANILALRGDPPQGRTMDWRDARFRHAVDLVRFLRREHADLHVAVAGYPAPHPESLSFAEDRAHTLEKVRAGANLIITQLFFDVREYFDLVGALRAGGLDVPVIPGILPIQSLDAVRRVIGKCGANIPGAFYLELEAAHRDGGAEAVREAGVRFAVKQIQALIRGGAPGIHLYTLNRAELCLRIAREAGDLSAIR